MGRLRLITWSHTILEFIWPKGSNKDSGNGFEFGC